MIEKSGLPLWIAAESGFECGQIQSGIVGWNWISQDGFADVYRGNR